MAQASTSFANLARSTTTIQILMIGASIGLHFLAASNLSWFGRLDPIKLKPAGGTVKVVDLTPAEQTRVPEAVKSNPLPIAPTQQNPEPATRSPGSSFSSGNPGTSVVVPNRTQLPPPSSQIPRTPNPRQPTQSPSVQNPPTNSTSKREIPIVPKPSRVLQDDQGGRSDQGNDVGSSGIPKKRRDPNSNRDTSTNNQDTNSNRTTQPNINLKPTTTPTKKPSPPVDPENTSEPAQLEFFPQAIQKFANLGVKVDIRRPITKIAPPYPSGESCRAAKVFSVVVIYKDYDDKDSNSLVENEEQGTEVYPKNTLGAVAANEGQKKALEQHRNRSTAQKSLERGKTISYEFDIRYGLC
jgi:hypothetical protein